MIKVSIWDSLRFFCECYGKKFFKSVSPKDNRSKISRLARHKLMKNYLALLLSLIALSGCMLGPKATLPTANLKDSFLEENGVAINQEPENEWWKTFKDPQLDRLISDALEGSLDIQLAMEKVKEVRASYHMESADLWPSINAFGSYMRLKKPQKILGFPTVGSPIQNLFALGFDASWEIDFFGKVRSSKKAAYEQILSQEESVRDAQVTVVSEVARLYTEVRTYQQRIFVTKELISVQEKLLELEKTLASSGLSSQIQVEVYKAELSQSKSLLPILQGGLKMSIYNLTFLLGKKPGEINDFFEKRKPIPNPEQKVPIGLPSDLLRRRPDIRAAERNYSAACAKIGQAKADLFPSISLTGVFAGISDQANTLFTQTAKTWLVWPTINWNIFQGWKTLANIKVQKSKQKQTLILYEKAISQSLKDVEVALSAYSEEGVSFQQVKSEVVAKKKVLKMTDCLFQAGLEQEMKVLISKKDFYKSEDVFFQSKEKVMLHLIALYKALGGGWSYHYGEKKS